jgi:hypothetical protein
MWIYKVKTDHLGHVTRCKARFAANGCSQRKSIDYKETFSPVVNMAGLRFFLAL